ncbi:putative kunitz inhibitor STI-like superfamily [Helianthus annuus]|nr:putative kunitz inhibitor STI-like superfamily [Helianthus annuus]
MKTIIFFSLAFFLCIFKANSAPGPVLDAGGKPLRSGVEYYATPTSIDGFDSSILRAPVGNKTCPAGAVEYYQNRRGGPDTYYHSS